jgi:PDZ domain
MGRGFLCLLLCLSLLVSSLWGSQKLQSRMTNQDVIELVSLGFSDGVIIDKIRTAQGSEFDTSIPALKDLQAAKVSDAVIRAMIDAQQNETGATLPGNPAGSSTGPLPIEIGVYIRVNGSLVEMEPEIVNWQTGGFVKTHATLGFVKGDLNGKISGATSPNQLSRPAVLVIRTAEGTSVTEYQLLHLHGKSNRREFRAVTGGVIHQSGGAERDTIHFEPRKIAERTWEISLGDLTAGEYGFLPPGVYSSSISSSGKMYTFGIAQEKEHPAATNARSSLDEVMEGPPAPPVEHGSIGASATGNPETRHDGVAVSYVEAGGPADQIGLKVGDVILALADRYVFTANELKDEVHKYQPGSSVTLRYRRYAIIFDIPITIRKDSALGKRPDPQATAF